jgi:type I restriction enzyme, S subunit
VKGKKEPGVRFPEFRGDWELRKFKDFISKAGKKNTAGKSYLAYSVSNKSGLIKQSEQFDGSRLDDLDKTSYKLVNYGEFAYNPARINVGSIAYNNLDKTVIVSSLYVVIKMSDKLDNEFILQFINSPNFNNEVRRNTEGSVREYLFFENFKNIKFPYISNKEEQIKIGNFFKKIDDTIALQQQELTTLKQTKQGFLQKMFPKEGESVPEVRFPGFTGEWEKQNLGDTFDTMTDFVANGSFEALRNNVNSYESENYAYMVRLQDASNQWKGPWLYTDKKGYSFLKKSTLFPGDIIMSNVGSVGKFFLIPDLNKPMTLAPNSVLIRSSKNDNYFLYQMMLTENIQNRVKEKTTPGVQSKINKTDFKKIELVIPTVKEQKLIGVFFKQLDDIISFHQRELDNLKETKKAFLQKMFA